MKLAVLSLGLLAAAGGDGKIEVGDLPEAVRSAVKARFPKATLLAAEKEEEGGRTVYEVSLREGGSEIDVSVGAKGKILEVEKAVDAEKLPRAVVEAIKVRHPKAKIRKAEEVVAYEDGDDEVGERFFEVDLSVEGEEDVELKVSREGKVLDDDDEAGEDGAKGDREGEGDE